MTTEILSFHVPGLDTSERVPPLHELPFKERLPIPRVDRPSAEFFLKDYFETKQPVIITGLLEQQWTFEQLTKEFGHEPVAWRMPVRLTSRETPSQNGGAPAPTQGSMLLANFVQEFLEHPGRGMYSQTAATESNLVAQLARRAVPAGFFPPHDMIYFWLGNGPGGIGLHHDAGADNAVFELIGEKHVLLIPAADLDCAVPFSYYASGNHSGSQFDTFRSQVNITTFDLSRFPQLLGARAYLATLGPGEVLYIPTSWFHDVHNTSANLSLSYRWHLKQYQQDRRTFIALCDLMFSHLKGLPSHVRDEFVARLRHELGTGAFVAGELFGGAQLKDTEPTGFRTWKRLAPHLLPLASSLVTFCAEQDATTLPAALSITPKTKTMLAERFGSRVPALTDSYEEFAALWALITRRSSFF